MIFLILEFFIAIIVFIFYSSFFILLTSPLWGIFYLLLRNKPTENYKENYDIFVFEIYFSSLILGLFAWIYFQINDAFLISIIYYGLFPMFLLYLGIRIKQYNKIGQLKVRSYVIFVSFLFYILILFYHNFIVCLILYLFIDFIVWKYISLRK